MTSPRMLSRARQGARKILSDCLQLQPGDAVTVFYDETTQEPARVILGEARRLELAVRERLVPLAQQQRFSSATVHGLDIEDADAIAGARGILTCLSGDAASMTFRRELVRAGTDPGRRLGHMPGATLSLLASAINIDYALASSRCDDLCLALCLGTQARLRTYTTNSRGKVVGEHDLYLGLGGPGRLPITSTGIIPLGTWGNLPGGETFIAPVEGTAFGTFALNGAFREVVLRAGESLLLSFEEGRLRSVQGPAEKRERLNFFVEYSREQQDEVSDAVAELGIGVNSGVARLTGNSLLDEKCAGTAHIALGDNSRYGGRLSSHIHEDLVTRWPCLWIDGNPILQKGHLAFVPAQWRESLATTTPDPDLSAPGLLIKRTSPDAELASDGTLRVRREVTAGRLCMYTVAERTTSVVLGSLYTQIPNFPQQIRILDLLKWAQNGVGLSPEQTSAALTILLRHGLIGARQQPS